LRAALDPEASSSLFMPLDFFTECVGRDSGLVGELISSQYSEVLTPLSLMIQLYVVAVVISLGYAFDVRHNVATSLETRNGEHAEAKGLSRAARAVKADVRAARHVVLPLI
jgi:hypothetical protein